MQYFFNYLNVFLFLIIIWDSDNISTNNDAAQPWSLYFQDSGSYIGNGIIELHDNILYILFIIFIFVSWLLFIVIYKDSVPLSYAYINTNKFNRVNISKQAVKGLNHGSLIEIIWTIIPALGLIIIAIPSFKLLYLIDEVIDPNITVKAIGHQWYWSYELSDFFIHSDNYTNVNFDSYMVPTDELEPGDLRLLTVDQSLYLPINTSIRLITTSTDVIHSFAVPSLGLKLDAIPGRINQSPLIINREGLYLGQCSELCGPMHFAMPIVIEGVNIDQYVTWLQNQSN